MNILVIDAQGGGIGRQLVTAISATSAFLSSSVRRNRTPACHGNQGEDGGG